MLGRTLSLGGERTESFDAATPLFGELPELDSMAVAVVLTAIEDHFGFLIEDDEISGELFETVGSLTAFVQERID